MSLSVVVRVLLAKKTDFLCQSTENRVLLFSEQTQEGAFR